MRWTRRFCAGLLLAVLWSGCLVAVGDPGPTGPGEKLTRLENEIQRLSAERDRLRGQEQGILGRLDRLAADARLLDARMEELKLLAGETARALEGVAQRISAQEIQLAESRGRYRATVLLLQRIGPLGRVRPVLDAPDAEKLASGLRLTHELTRRQQGQVSLIRDQIAELESLRKARRETERELAALEEKAVASRRELSRAIRSRRGLLQRIRSETTTRDQALAELNRARSELQAIVEGRTAAHEVSLDVRRFRDLLPMPLKGRVSLAFGDRRDPRFGTVIPHPGWDVEAEFGTPVAAPFDANVVFSDWFRGYGLVVVLDHGHAVHSVYAHLSAILVEVGDSIVTGQTVGRVGDTGSLRGPYLYMEFRQDGKAVDPAGWIR